MKLFMINGVDIKAFAKMKMALNGVCQTLAKLVRLNNWPNV